MRSKTESSASNYDGVSVSAVILCAGKGERTGLTYNKILYNLGQKTVLETVLDKFKETCVGEIMLVTTAEDAHDVSVLSSPYNNISMCLGGASRAQSVQKGLRNLTPCDIVVIHDGARPYVSVDTINASIESAIRYGSGVVAVPTVDTIKQVTDYNIVCSLSRSGLYNIQTPQTFRYSEILNAYNSVSGIFTDDSEVYSRAGYTPRIVIGTYDNLKITTPTDLFRTLPSNMRVGIGFDVHKLVRGRKLVLGGVEIPYTKGLEGHSDADVLTHAIMDAILSAANLPDIGVLFPDNDPNLLGISSMVLLDHVLSVARKNGYTVNNISAVIIAQAPKMAPVIGDIRHSLATVMNINPDMVNISATTTENLGIIGKGNAIAASASCLLTEIHG